MAKAMTEGNETKLIFLFSLPIIAGNFLQQLYNTADTVIVGKFVGEGALAAVGTCAPLTLFFIAVAIGLSAGSGIIVAQHFGAGDLDAVRRAASTALILMTGLGLALSATGGVIARLLIKHLLIVPEDILPDASLYFSIYCTGLVFQFAYNIVAALLRAIGDSRATLYFLAISAATNIVLDLVFVILFGWGVAGAAIATVLSQAACAAVSTVYLFKKYPVMRFQPRFDRPMFEKSLTLGIPSCVQQTVVSLGHLAIQRLVNSYGQETMAAYTAGSRIEQYVMIPIFGFAIGLSTFTGQNLGAGLIARIKTGYAKTTRMSLATCVLLALVAYFGAPAFIGLFGLNGRSLAMGIEYLRFIALCLPIFAVYMTTSHLLQGSGDVIFAMLITLGTLCTRVLVSYLMAPTPLDYRALWMSPPIAWALAFLFAFYRYKQGKWQVKSVVGDKKIS